MDTLAARASLDTAHFRSDSVLAKLLLSEPEPIYMIVGSLVPFDLSQGRHGRIQGRASTKQKSQKSRMGQGRSLTNHIGINDSFVHRHINNLPTELQRRKFTMLIIFASKQERLLGEVVANLVA